MWAGGRVQFHRPMRVGDEVARQSTIEDVTVKEGRSGALVFVKVRHELRTDALLITEHQDIVYRGEAQGAPPPPKKARTDAQWQRSILPNEPLLFRYSALTFNSHRIHYDRPYATQVEGYPDLVVHGPLIATLLVDVALRELPGRKAADFSYRAVAPLFAGQPFHVCGRVEGDKVALWAASSDGALAMEADLRIE
jgi:3-methylfumaryl-CoA hydratase